MQQLPMYESAGIDSLGESSKTPGFTRILMQVAHVASISSTPEDALVRLKQMMGELGGMPHLSLVTDEFLLEAIRVCFERKFETAFVPRGE